MRYTFIVTLLGASSAFALGYGCDGSGSGDSRGSCEGDTCDPGSGGTGSGGADAGPPPPFDPPDAGAGCDRFYHMASGEPCPNDGCPPVGCDCGEDFPKSVTACTPDGCVIHMQCPAACAADLGELVECTDTYKVATPCMTASGSHTLAPDPLSLQIADLNGDGHLDFVTAHSANSISVLLGDGMGGFTATTSPGPAGPLTLGDFRGIGVLDIAAINYGPASVSILQNDGAGTFMPAGSFGVGKYPQGLAAAELDGDGKIDLAVASSDENAVQVFKNDGDGEFSMTGAYPFSSEDGVRDVAAGDINKDGKIDLVVSHVLGKAVSAFLNKGDGTFYPAARYPVGSNGAWDLVIADVDESGWPDLVIATGDVDGYIAVLYNRGDGSFVDPVYYMGGPICVGVRVADMNGDGHLDVVAANEFALTILLNNGNGSFGPQISYPHPDTYAVGLGDFNGDKRPDIAVSTRSAGTVEIFLNACSP